VAHPIPGATVSLGERRHREARTRGIKLDETACRAVCDKGTQVRGAILLIVFVLRVALSRISAMIV
jgi:hypothetical protein